jgi:Zn-dependent protease
MTTEGQGEADLEAVEAELEKLGRPASNPGQGAWLLVLSAVLFLSAQRMFGGDQPWLFVGVMIAVLVLHELGHLAAMRAFGFQDLRMFFIPLFGAAAAGRKPDATGTQRAIVALAGPVPGIVAGFALLFAFGEEGLGEVGGLFVGLMLILNFFNLVPLLPFDGGRLVHIVLFSRWPIVELGFRLVAGAALGWLAMRMENVVIGVVAAFTVLGAGWNVRVARLGQQLRARVPAPRPASLLAISAEARAGAMADTVRTMKLSTYSPRAARTIAVLMTRGWERAHDTPPGLGASAALLVVWAAFMASAALLFRPGGAA